MSWQSRHNSYGTVSYASVANAVVGRGLGAGSGRRGPRPSLDGRVRREPRGVDALGVTKSERAGADRAGGYTRFHSAARSSRTVVAGAKQTVPRHT